MDIHIDDSVFIDLINVVTGEEIAALESSVEDLESELSDKCDEEYVDDLATDLRAEWQQEIESAIDNMPSPSVDSLEDEVNEIENGMGIFDNGIGGRQGLRAIFCCGDNARSKGSEVKPNS